MPELSLFDAELRPAEAGMATARPRPGLPAPTTTITMTTMTTTGPRVLVVDGNSLAHRAFHAYADVTTAAGRPLGAVYGFLALLCGIADKVDPDGLVVGFDCRESSWRKEAYPGYKAQRPEKDPALVAQLQELVVLLERLGVAVVVPEGWEADDVLGSAAATAAAVGWRAVLATSDRDAYGLISPTTTVLRLRSGLDQALELGEPALRRRLGIAASQYLEYAALRGDTSDNLPGVEGIGPKRAAALLQEYPTVTEAAADPFGCTSVLGLPAGRALLDDLADPGASVFHRNCRLMRIRDDLPLEVDDWPRRTRPEDLERHLLAWELPQLVRRVQLAIGVRPEAPPPPSDEDAPPAARDVVDAGVDLRHDVDARRFEDGS